MEDITSNEGTPLLLDQQEHHVQFLGDVDGNGETPKVVENGDVETGGREDSAIADDAKKPKKKKKKKRVTLNYQTALALETQIQMNLTKHTLAADHYNHRQYWRFTFPQAVFTALSSTLAFSASSETFSAHAETINLVVGFLAALVVLIQTISGFKIYGVRADRHRNVSVQLRDLVDDISLMKFKLNMVDEHEKQHIKSLQRKKQEDEQAAAAGGVRRSSTYSLQWDGIPEHDEHIADGDDDDDEDQAETFDSIQKRYQQSLSGCNSNVPMELTEAFHGLTSNLDIAETKENIERLHNIYGHVNYRSILLAKANDIMTGEILNDPWFPAYLPDSKKMVERSMKVLKERLRKSTVFYEGLDKPEVVQPKRFSIFGTPSK